MDRQMILDHLALAERHVAESAADIERQSKTLAELEQDGHTIAAESARSLLALFENLQAQHVADRDGLLKELSS